jgi:hypothetical protein
MIAWWFHRIHKKLLQNEHKYRLKDVGPPLRYLGAQIGK